MFSVYAPAPNINDAAVLQEYAVYGTALNESSVDGGQASAARWRPQEQRATGSGGDVSSGGSGSGGTGDGKGISSSSSSSSGSGGSSTDGSSTDGSGGSGDEEGAAHDALYAHASASSDADLGVVVGAKPQRQRRRRRSSRHGDRFNLDTLIESDASCARLLDYCAQQPKMLEPLLLWMDLEQFSSLPPTTSAAEVGRTARTIVRKYLSSHSDLPVGLAEHVRRHAIAAVAACGAEVAAADSSTDGGDAARDGCGEPSETAPVVAQSEESGPALNAHAAPQLVHAFGQLRHATRRHIERRVLPFFGAAMAAGHLESAAATASTASAVAVPRLALAVAPAGDLPLAGSTPPMLAHPLPPLPPRPWSAIVIDYKTMAGFDWRRPLKTSYVAYVIEVEMPVEGEAGSTQQARATTQAYTIRRRFREFWGLHQLLASKLPDVDLAAFPRRLEGLRPGAAEGLRAKRSGALTTYLASVLAAAPCWRLEGVQSFFRPRLDDCVKG
jgi:hypothetical protein